MFISGSQNCKTYTNDLHSEQQKFGVLMFTDGTYLLWVKDSSDL